MSRPALSILVVSYNSRELTLAALESVYAQTTETPFETIVLDNASTDGSADAIAARFPQVRLIRSPDNLGFARGNNEAAKVANGEYLLLLNPDTVVLNHAIDRLVAFARAQPAARIWGGRTLNADRSLNAASCWRRMTLWSLLCNLSGLSAMKSSPIFASESYGGWDRSTVREVDIVTGCFLLIERTFWNELGGFDLSYFMYGEEADLCLRAIQRGAHPAITPDASIIHYSSTADPVRADKMVAIAKAKVTLIRRHWPRLLRPLGRAMFILTPLSRAIAYSAAGLLLARASARERARVWLEVWRRRGQWGAGYPAANVS